MNRLVTVPPEHRRPRRSPTRGLVANVDPVIVRMPLEWRALNLAHAPPRWCRCVFVDTLVDGDRRVALKLWIAPPLAARLCG